MKKLILEMNDMMILKNKNNMQSVSSSQTVFIASTQTNKSMSKKLFKPITQMFVPESYIRPNKD